MARFVENIFKNNKHCLAGHEVQHVGIVGGWFGNSCHSINNKYHVTHQHDTFYHTYAINVL